MPKEADRARLATALKRSCELCRLKASELCWTHRLWALDNRVLGRLVAVRDRYATSREGD